MKKCRDRPAENQCDRRHDLKPDERLEADASGAFEVGLGALMTGTTMPGAGLCRVERRHASKTGEMPTF
jgi:hypothetical protein